MRIQHAIFCVLFSLTMLAGCGIARKEITYRDADGREIKYLNEGFDTKISGITFEKTPDGGLRMNMENYSSEAKIAQEAIKAQKELASQLIPKPLP